MSLSGFLQKNILNGSLTTFCSVFLSSSVPAVSAWLPDERRNRFSSSSSGLSCWLPTEQEPKEGLPSPRRVDLIIDIQNRLAQGKGPAYERWAKVYNIKQMAAALLYLREHGLADYEALAASTEAAVDRFHTLAGELRDTEATLSHTSQLMGAVVQYAKTRPVFDGYKAARYSKKYLAQHETELSDYRAAKAAMNELLDGAKLPKMDALKKKRRELAEKKKALYAEYRKAQADMREAVAVKGNIDHLLGHTDERDKAQER